jgi:hypothetical protein
MWEGGGWNWERMVSTNGNSALRQPIAYLDPRRERTFMVAVLVVVVGRAGPVEPAAVISSTGRCAIRNHKKARSHEKTS